MIELKSDELVFSFPEVSPDAKLSISFQRTLRIPDDDRSYPLPPGLGKFSLRHVDDFAQDVPLKWLEHGGLMLPMYQSEAMWLHFQPNPWTDRGHAYPFAIKIAAGKIDAVTGRDWSNNLNRRPQDYVVAPPQPWLDGFAIRKGIIRQFVAMPLGSGYSAEEQLTGAAEHGGLQIIAYPMKRDAFERRYRKRRISSIARRRSSGIMCCPDSANGASMDMDMDMGLAPGGQMRQNIQEDPYDFDEWDHNRAGRCFIHLANSLIWRKITGSNPPTTPPTAAEYTRAGLPWFEYYDDHLPAIASPGRLSKLKSIVTIATETRDVPLPENESVTPRNIAILRKHLGRDQVREGVF
jgi:hypothetical protein